jgi:deferrochelatase/peroxidase EfeB
LGITWPGLEALGWHDERGDASRAFAAFREGPAARAGNLGDVGDSAPERWIGGLGSGRDHVLLVLYAADEATLDGRAADLERVLLAGGAFEMALRFDAEALPGERVHFGYRDGISQPRIEGAPNVLEDGQSTVPAWHFVLRDDAITYRLPEPAELFRNGSFGILRILEQDVAGFEAMLEANRAQIDPELLAAKLMGRWRNGVPLVLSPDASEPVPPIAPEELNRFDYLADRAGHQCPIGAHIRRTFPRSQVVAGGTTRNRRLVRRGLPYGPPFVPGQAADGIARGLIGMFINAQIEDQYEFVIKQWMNLGGFTAHLPNDSRDFFASGDGSAREFEVPLGPAAAVRVRTLSSFIKTRGSAYCLLPSRTGLTQLIR